MSDKKRAPREIIRFIVSEDGLTEMQQGVHRQDGITWQKIRPG